MQASYDDTAAEFHADDIVFDETKSPARFDMAALMRSVQRHIDSHQTVDQTWPADAMYAVQYQCRTWPCGWDSYQSVRFFRNSDELSEFVRSMNKWAREEDNDWRHILYMWDLGPVLVTDEIAHIH